MWSEKVEYDDPQPFLRDENAASIERLLKHDIPPALIQTVFPADREGYFDLDSNSMTMEMKPPGSHQSTLPSVVRMTKEQYDTLCKLSYGQNEQREMLERLRNHAQEHEEHVFVQVLSADRAIIDQAIEKKEDGEWQNPFREVIKPLEESGSR